MSYPHGSACRCPELPTDAGLLRFTVDCDHYDAMARALARIAGKADTATLRVLTTGPEPDNLVALPNTTPCDGSYTCPCSKHAAERAARIKNGVRHGRQPWDPIRRRAAA